MRLRPSIQEAQSYPLDAGAISVTGGTGVSSLNFAQLTEGLIGACVGLYSALSVTLTNTSGGALAPRGIDILRCVFVTVDRAKGQRYIDACNLADLVPFCSREGGGIVVLDSSGTILEPGDTTSIADTASATFTVHLNLPFRHATAKYPGEWSIAPRQAGASLHFELDEPGTNWLDTDLNPDTLTGDVFLMIDPTIDIQAGVPWTCRVEEFSDNPRTLQPAPYRRISAYCEDLSTPDDPRLRIAGRDRPEASKAAIAASKNDQFRRSSPDLEGKVFLDSCLRNGHHMPIVEPTDGSSVADARAQSVRIDWSTSPTATDPYRVCTEVLEPHTPGTGGAVSPGTFSALQRGGASGDARRMLEQYAARMVARSGAGPEGKQHLLSPKHRG